MKAIGVPPGAIIFRLSLMIIIVAILVVVFLRYIDDSRLAIERQSILQTRRIIDSSLVVVFSTYAVDGRLNELDDLEGANPFGILRRYQMLPPSYRGEIETDLNPALESGWYFLTHRGLVAYRPFHLSGDLYFRLVLNYEDLNQSGSFEYGEDAFRGLRLMRHL